MRKLPWHRLRRSGSGEPILCRLSALAALLRAAAAACATQVLHLSRPVRGTDFSRVPVMLVTSAEVASFVFGRRRTSGHLAAALGKRSSVPVRDETGRFIGVRPKTAAERAQV